MLALTHLPKPIALLAAVVLLSLILWYWHHLESSDISSARRRLRRLSLVPAVLAVVGAAFGFGVVDPDVQPLPYVVAWSVTLPAIALTVGCAIADACISIAEHVRLSRAARAERRDALLRLNDEARRRAAEAKR